MKAGSQRQVPADLPPEKTPGTYSTGGYVGPRMVWTGTENIAATKFFFKQSGQFLIQDLTLVSTNNETYFQTGITQILLILFRLFELIYSSFGYIT
jgi:hypothetical protein